MYVSALARSFQGIIAIPSRPVIKPPVLNEIRRGERLAKSFAGLTTFAAILTERVAIPTPSREIAATTPRTAAEAISGSACPGGGVAVVGWERMKNAAQMPLGSAPCRIVFEARVLSTPASERVTVVVCHAGHRAYILSL